MNETATILIFAAEGYVGRPPRNALEFSAWLTELLESIPEEFRASAELVIDSERGYDDGTLETIEVKYRRPMTDEEQASVDQERADERERRAKQLRAELARVERIHKVEDARKARLSQ